MERVSAAELSEWEAYYEMEPWGSRFLDVHLARIAATLFNAHRDSKKQSAVKPQTLFVCHNRPRTQSRDQIAAAVRQAHALCGGRMIVGRK